MTYSQSVVYKQINDFFYYKVQLRKKKWRTHLAISSPPHRLGSNDMFTNQNVFTSWNNTSLCVSDWDGFSYSIFYQKYFFPSRSTTFPVKSFVCLSWSIHWASMNAFSSRTTFVERTIFQVAGFTLAISCQMGLSLGRKRYSYNCLQNQKKIIEALLKQKSYIKCSVTHSFHRSCSCHGYDYDFFTVRFFFFSPTTMYCCLWAAAAARR